MEDDPIAYELDGVGLLAKHLTNNRDEDPDRDENQREPDLDWNRPRMANWSWE
jgi:hypothetical protein